MRYQVEVPGDIVLKPGKTLYLRAGEPVQGGTLQVLRYIGQGDEPKFEHGEGIVRYPGDGCAPASPVPDIPRRCGSVHTGSCTAETRP